MQWKKTTSKERTGPSTTPLYEHHNFPCLVENGEEVEDPAATTDEDEHFNRVARNGLRHLTYGVDFFKAGLFTWANIKSLVIKPDPRLFTALRREMQNLFLNTFKYVNAQHKTASDLHLQIFINQMLSDYPFMYPEANETVQLPQKINNEWVLVKYRFELIDISPQTGLLSDLIEDRDRLYAYGLVPVSHPNAQPMILVEGTCPPSSKSRDLNWLYNFKPYTSVGEGHNRSKIAEWLQHHLGARIIGASKGATLAMIIAALFPHLVKNADCYSSTALAEATHQRLQANWENIPETELPDIALYTKKGDPVYLIDHRLLKHIKIYKIDGPGTYSLQAHAHCYSGRKSFVITAMETSLEDYSPSHREFISDIKATLNWVMFPFLYTQLVLKLCARKINRFCDQHATVLSIACFILLVTTCIALAASGVFSPFIAPIISSLGPTLGYTYLTGLMLLVTPVIALVTPKLASIATELAIGISFVVGSISAFAATMTAQAILSGVKIGIKSMFGYYAKREITNHVVLSKPENIPEETTVKMKKVLKRKDGTEVQQTHQPMPHSSTPPTLSELCSNKMEQMKSQNKEESGVSEDIKSSFQNRR